MKSPPLRKGSPRLCCPGYVMKFALPPIELSKKRIIIMRSPPAAVDPDSKEGRRVKRLEKRRYEALGGREDAHNLVLREDVDGLVAAAGEGLDLEAPDDDGCTPACFAAMRDAGDVLDALAACGVDLGAPDASGSAAGLASIAATRGKTAALSALARHVDLATHAGRDGWTAAGAAALAGNAASLDALKGLGVDLAARCNRHGETPAAVARKVGHRGLPLPAYT